MDCRIDFGISHRLLLEVEREKKQINIRLRPGTESNFVVSNLYLTHSDSNLIETGFCYINLTIRPTESPS